MLPKPDPGHDLLGQLIQDLDLIVGIVTVGTTKKQVYRLRRAADNITAWQPLRHPFAREERGGSSSPREREDGAEDRRVGQSAVRDAIMLEQLIGTLTPTVRELAQLVARYTVTTDHAKLPKADDGIPGCVSCARPQRLGKRTLPGHFAPVDARYAGLKLCRWCGDHRDQDGNWPALEAVDIRHRQSEHAATKWIGRTMLAKRPVKV